MELQGHNGEVFATRFDPTGQFIASGSMDRSICLSPPRKRERYEANFQQSCGEHTAHAKTSAYFQEEGTKEPFSIYNGLATQKSSTQLLQTKH